MNSIGLVTDGDRWRTERYDAAGRVVWHSGWHRNDRKPKLAKLRATRELLDSLALESAGVDIAEFVGQGRT